MNALTKFVLKVFSSPKIDMHESYKSVRKFQELTATPQKEKYRILDREIYSEDLTHEIPVRIFHPKVKVSDELLLFFHGGGWVIGSIDSYTRDCIQLADELGRTILAVDYLKAPENPFPAGFDDCYRVADILINQPDLSGITGAAELVFMGNSAGGNLAAAVSLRLRDEGKQLPKKQILINPVTFWNHDERSPFASVEENGFDYGLTNKKMQEYMEMYEPNEAARQSPYIAPIMTDDFTNQPETLIITSEFDPLRDEGEAYGHLLKDAGNNVRIFRAQDTVHNYIFGPLTSDIKNKSYQLMKGFLDNTLKGSDSLGEKEGDKSEELGTA